MSGTGKIMKRKLLVMLCLFSLVSSCLSTKSRLHNDEKYLCSRKKQIYGFAYKTKDFYIHKGSLIKENNRYYFFRHCFYIPLFCI